MAIVVNGKKVAGVGLPGKDGAPGADGKDGAPGKSAYQAAKERGYTGTEEEFNTALAGMQSAPFLPLSGGTVEGVLEIRSGIEFGYGSNSIELSPSSASRLELVANASGGFSGGSIGGTVELIGLSAPTASNSAANKQYVDEHAGARVILGSYVGTGRSGKSNPNQITLAAPLKYSVFMACNGQIRIEVSTILVLAKLLSLFPAALSLLSIQAALVFSTLATQEILTVKNQRMEKLSVGIITILHLMQQLCSLIYLKLYITTTP